MIIGEASVALTIEFKNKYTSFDWNLMSGMRNIIVHEYFGVDEQKVWDTVVNDIPRLISDCKMALKDFD